MTQSNGDVNMAPVILQKKLFQITLKYLSFCLVSEKRMRIILVRSLWSDVGTNEIELLSLGQDSFTHSCDTRQEGALL